MANDESQSSESASQAPDATSTGGEAQVGPFAWELFLDAHYKKLIIAGIAVVVAIFVGIIVQNRAHTRLNTAANAFSEATTIAEFEAVSQDHRGTFAGGSALLMKADLELKADKLTESQATLTSFINSYPDHPLHHQGLFALGVQATAKGDLDEADSYFQKVIDDDNAIDLAPLAVIRTGDIAYERGKIEEARDIYSSVNPTYPGTPYGIIAQQKLQRNALLPPAPAPKPTPIPQPVQIPAPTGAPAKAGNPPAKDAKTDGGAKSKPSTKPADGKAGQEGEKGGKKEASAAPKAEKPSE